MLWLMIATLGAAVDDTQISFRFFEGDPGPQTARDFECVVVLQTESGLRVHGQDDVGPATCPPGKNRPSQLQAQGLDRRTWQQIPLPC